MSTHESDEAEIQRFLRERGVTHCPTAYAESTQASIRPADRARIHRYSEAINLQRKNRQKAVTEKIKRSSRSSEITQRRKATSFDNEIRPIFEEIIASGITMNSRIARELNRREIRSFYKTPWSDRSVHRMRKRLEQ